MSDNTNLQVNKKRIGFIMNYNISGSGSSNNETHEDQIIPRSTDVLCGRIGRPNCNRLNSGTKLYRNLVKNKQEEYATCPLKNKKGIIISIVEAVRKQSGRFLHKTKYGTWYILGHKEAIKKTSQALRERQPPKRQELYQNISRLDKTTALTTVEKQLDLPRTPDTIVTLKVPPECSQEKTAPDPAVGVAPATSSLPFPCTATVFIEQPKEQNELSQNLSSSQKVTIDDICMNSSDKYIERFWEMIDNENDFNEFASFSAA